MQHCCVSSWGINSHHLPAAREALAVLLDLKANVPDYKVTFYILYMHLSLLLSLTRKNSSLFPHAFKAQKPNFGWIVFMDDYFLEKPLGVQLGRCLSVKKLHASDYKNYLKHIFKTLSAET